MQQIHAAGSNLLSTRTAAVRVGGIGKPVRLYNRPKGSKVEVSRAYIGTRAEHLDKTSAGGDKSNASIGTWKHRNDFHRSQLFDLCKTAYSKFSQPGTLPSLRLDSSMARQ